MMVIHTTLTSNYVIFFSREAITACNSAEFVAEALELPHFQDCVQQCKESLHVAPASSGEQVIGSMLEKD